MTNAKRHPVQTSAVYHRASRGEPRQDVIDAEGYRLNVGIVLCNGAHQVLWARRAGMRSWQFPQGGIHVHEEPDQAMFRELHEEIGLRCHDVDLIGRTSCWLHYHLPERYIRRNSQPLCIGQKQIWYILQLRGDESAIRLDCSEKPEFDSWRWVDYWFPVSEVVYFKREVYRQALTELRLHLFSPVEARDGIGSAKEEFEPIPSV